MYHLFVYNTSNQVCHNCILTIRAFSRVCTIMLQLLHILPINPCVCFLTIACTISCIHYIGTLGLQRQDKSEIRRYALLKATRNLLNVYLSVPCPTIAAIKRHTKLLKSSNLTSWSDLPTFIWIV